MPNVTAKQLSEVIGVGIDKLLDQLKTAGVQVSGPDDREDERIEPGRVDQTRGAPWHRVAGMVSGPGSVPDHQ